MFCKNYRRSVDIVVLAVLLAGLSGGRVAQAHLTQPTWADLALLDGGLYVAFDHPRVVRQPGSVSVRVTVRNISGAQDIQVNSVTFIPPPGRPIERRVLNQLLPTHAPAFEQYVEAHNAMLDRAVRLDRPGVEAWAQQCRALLAEITSDGLLEDYTIPGAWLPLDGGQVFGLTVEIEVLEGAQVRVIRRLVEIPVQPRLPDGTAASQPYRFDVASGLLHPASDQHSAVAGGPSPIWFAGDQHLHTTDSVDATILDGTLETVADYAAAAEVMGLDWIMVTDHSNVHFTWRGIDYYTAEQFNAGSAQAADYSASHPLLALNGQEMGLGQRGFFDLPSHYLAYPLSVDSTGFLENPSSGLIFGHVNCEAEQVIIDRVAAAGGFGFIAHSMASGPLSFAKWNFSNGADGWAGMEIWTDNQGRIKRSDSRSFDKWLELLNAIAPPIGGELANRPGFPNAFPVGLGNSDAHKVGLIGATFTYAWMDSVTRPQVTNALMQGQCVASNGPLLFGTLNGAHISQVALLLAGDNTLQVTLTSTAEFGPVGDYDLTVYVNGAVRLEVPATGVGDLSATFELDGLNLAPPDTYVTLRADSVDGDFHALTNPIWLQFATVGDGNADGLVGLGDLSTLSECLSGPGRVRLESCDVMDLDRDRDVDLQDFGGLQRAGAGG